MRLKDCLNAYEGYSGKASDVARTLSLSGFAVIWVLRESGPGAPFLPNPLYWPGLFFVAALAFDLLQYVYGAIAWGRFHRQQELRGVGADTDFKAPRWVNRPTNTLFGLKLLSVGVGYALLLIHLLGRIPASQAPSSPATAGASVAPDFGWPLLERVLVDGAAVATVVAVWFAWKALRDSEHTANALNESLAIARAERTENSRARAALVLQRADLLAAVLQSVWHYGLAYDVVRPPEERLDSYLREAEAETGWANNLLDRASQVDPELSAYAYLVGLQITGIRRVLGTARGDALRWETYRRRVVEHATQARELLSRMEMVFPTSAVTVQGLTRQEFLTRARVEAEAAAKSKVEQLLKEIGQPGSTEGK